MRNLTQESFRTRKNHTAEGFKLVRVPDLIKTTLYEYWERNKSRMKEERWPKGTTIVNHWDAPTYIVHVKRQHLRGGGDQWNEIEQVTKQSMEQWTGLKMRLGATHGIRVHTHGAVIPPHVTKVPYMISAIVHVAQDLDEDWVFELYNRGGTAVNLTLTPGSMLLFESSSLIHGVGIKQQIGVKAMHAFGSSFFSLLYDDSTPSR